MSNGNRTRAASPLIASAVGPGKQEEQSTLSALGGNAGLLQRIAARLLSAVLVALVITLTLVGVSTLYGWYKGVQYPEGIVARSLAVGVILFAALTAAILWECRTKR